MVPSHAEKRARALKPDLRGVLQIVAGALAYLAVMIPCLAWPGGVLFFRPGAGIVAIAALLYGPAIGFGAGFLGDLLLGLWQGNVWLHWSLGVGVFGLITGLLWLWSDIDTEKTFGRRDAAKVAFFSTAGAIIGAFTACLIDMALGAALGEVLSVWVLPVAVLQALWGFGLASVLMWVRARYLGRPRRVVQPQEAKRS